MKKNLYLIIFCIIMNSFSTKLIRAEEKPVILVLGIESSEISEIQDRIIREEIMRRFYEKQYRITSVMELTGLIEENQINVQALKKEDIPSVTYRLNADAAIFSKKTGSKELTIFIYHKSQNKFFQKSIIIDLNGDFNTLCPILIDEIFKNSFRLLEEIK